jgi:CheY-like chemotaxis protein
MALLITHTGQSGVERGADRAARTVGFTVEGFCTFEQRDELAVLPPEILADLTPCPQRGARSALRATLERANVLVIAVPDVSEANSNAGVEALRRSARLAGVPHWVVDPLSDLDEVATKFRRMELVTDPLRVMISGPRLTRWRDGERLGWRVVAQLSLAPVAVMSKHRILVVDDHRDTAETTCQLLRALGHECQAATSGVSGLEAAAVMKPDIALLDIGLPDLSGYEVARRLREAQPQNLFLAAITGWDQAQDARDAIAAGFDRHVIKPAGVDIIRGLLGQAELQLAG